jgi:glycosyltransferase involved in cell wall biosynthesis
VAGRDRISRSVRYRWGRYRRRAAQLVDRRRPDTVLFVCGPAGDARRYRCDHQVEQLERAGLPARVVYRDGLKLASLAARYRAVVLYRVPWDEDVGRLIERDGIVLADVDDLVFDATRAELIPGLDRLTAVERRAYLVAVEGLGRTLAEVDGVVVSTDPLGEEAARTGRSVGVAYNAVSAEMVRLAERARRRARAREGVVIAYLSGTATHDRDFAEAADAVLDVLERHRDVRFLTVGELTLDARFDSFGDRVERRGFVHWRELPEVLAGVDVNLAPLEPANPVTASKSCLKYLEAALLGVPTVASPRPDFARVIEHGENGLLADDPESWSAALEELIELPGKRTDLGEGALADVLARRTTSAAAGATTSVFLGLLRSMFEDGS